MSENELYIFLKTLLLESGNMSEAQISKEINVNQQNFNRKLKSGTLRFLEVQKMLNVLGYKLYLGKDGTMREIK